jgi:hypothetical protein
MGGSRSHSVGSSIDFAIITAIEVERRAICRAFRLTDKHREKRDGRVYWRGRLPLKNGEFYELAVAQSPDMANLDAALLAVDCLRHWQPEALLMVGIAAAATTDQELGDRGSWQSSLLLRTWQDHPWRPKTRTAMVMYRLVRMQVAIWGGNHLRNEPPLDEVDDEVGQEPEEKTET